MELGQLFTLLRRWYWLLILGLLVGLGSGFLISRLQNPVYEATTKVLIMHTSQQSNSSFAYLSDQQLTQTFGQLITIQSVLDAVSNKLGVKVYSTQIQVQPIQDTQIVKVIVDDQNPKHTASIANALVKETIQRYEGLQVNQSSTSEASLNSQIIAVQSQMATLQSEIDQTSESIIKSQMDQILSQMTPLQNQVSSLQKEIALLSPPDSPDQNSAIADKQSQLNEIQPLLTAYQLAYSNLLVLKKPMDLGSADENKLALFQKTLALYQQNFIDLTSQLQSVRQQQSQSTSNVIQIETASVPTTPIRPRILINALLAGAVGLVLAVIGIFLIENPDVYLKISPNYSWLPKWLGRKEDVPVAIPVKEKRISNRVRRDRVQK